MPSSTPPPAARSGSTNPNRSTSSSPARNEDPQPHVSPRLARGLKTTYYLRTLQASNIEKSTSVKKEVSGIAGGKREFTAEEQLACSIEAMRNGAECEACQ